MTSDKQPAAKRDAAYFDQWYADMTTSSVRDAIVARTLGLPPELQSTSLLAWQGIAEVTDELRMPQDGLLLDLACGRGGYGIEVACRTGARLIGVDFSGVALEQARSSSARLLPAGRSKFQVGTLLATGLARGRSRWGDVRGRGAVCRAPARRADRVPSSPCHRRPARSKQLGGR